MYTSFQANTTKNCYRKNPDVSPICLLQRSSCIGFSYPAQFGLLTLMKRIGFALLYMPLVTLHLLACHCPSNLHGWWEVQYSLSPPIGLTGIAQEGLTTSLLCPMTLIQAFTIRQDPTRSWNLCFGFMLLYNAYWRFSPGLNFRSSSYVMLVLILTLPVLLATNPLVYIGSTRKVAQLELEM